MTNQEIEKSYLNKYDTVEVTVTYTAEVTATVSLHTSMTIDEIKEELKNGYCRADMDDNEYIKLNKITELIVNGYEIEI